MYFYGEGLHSLGLRSRAGRDMCGRMGATAQRGVARRSGGSSHSEGELIVTGAAPLVFFLILGVVAVVGVTSPTLVVSRGPGRSVRSWLSSAWR